MSVFIPHTTLRQLWPREYLANMVYQAIDPSMGVGAEAQVRAALASRYRFDPRDDRAVTIFGSRQIMQITDGMAGGLQIVLIFIGTLTLTIGGVGVMNIMLVSVQERTREIGVRKALGARRRHILLQFLLEGLAITFAGGAAGILLSYLFVALVGSQPFLAELIDDPTRQTDILLILSPRLLLTATGILGVTGLLSGFFPAFRASRMHPIESLRYE
jgi:putative ABC transport system permease protein